MYKKEIDLDYIQVLYFKLDCFWQFTERKLCKIFYTGETLFNYTEFPGCAFGPF